MSRLDLSQLEKIEIVLQSCQGTPVGLRSAYGLVADIDGIRRRKPDLIFEVVPPRSQLCQFGFSGFQLLTPKGRKTLE